VVPDRYPLARRLSNVQQGQPSDVDKTMTSAIKADAAVRHYWQSRALPAECQQFRQLTPIEAERAFSAAGVLCTKLSYTF